MPNTSKSSKKTSPANGQVVATEFVDTFTTVYSNSVERVAELQKTCLDAAAEQTTEWIGAWKNVFSSFPVAPPTFFFDIAGQTVQTLVDTQKSAIDLVVEQTGEVAKIAKLRADAYSKIAETTAGAVQTTVTRSVEAQKKVLDFAAAQNKTICEATKKQVGGGPAAVVVDTFERGVNTLIGVQKSILDTTTQPFAAAAKA
jgi:hypothetical protein